MRLNNFGYLHLVSAPPRHPHRALAIAMAFTLFGLGGLGAALMAVFIPGSLSQLLHLNAAQFLKVAGIGTLFASFSLIPLLLLLQSPYLRGTRSFFADLMADYRVQTWQIWTLSLCAGVGEELLFRGFIQHYLGIGLTAILFVFLHGYLNPLNRPLFVYGLVLCAVSFGFGWICSLYTLPAAMIAHFWIDVALLYYLRKHQPSMA